MADKIKKKKKINISLLIGIIIVSAAIILAVCPSFFTTFDPEAIDSQSMLAPPSALHLFGTDLFIGVGAMIVPFFIGTAVGIISGYYGGKIDALLMRILDIFMAFPYMVLAIAIVAITGAGIKALFISMWLVGWKEYTRLVRSEVLVVKNSEYVEAAKVLGYSDLRVIMRSIIPNVLSSAIVYGASDIVMCMMSGAAMSYLGLGVQAPTPEWGAIISGGKAFLSVAWWITVFPGIFLVITGLGFSLIGDGLSDMLRQKGR